MIVKLETEIGKYISVATLTAFNDDGTPFIHKGSHHKKQYPLDTDKNTTMQSREIKILLRGCRELKGQNMKLIIKPSSPYISNCLKSLAKWQQSNWLTGKGKEVKHKEEWQEIYELIKNFETEVQNE